MATCGGFEGNAQTLRILATLEKKESRTEATKLGISDEMTDERLGINPSYRSLASILKYDNRISYRREDWDGIKKGYYDSQSDLVDKIKYNVIGDDSVDMFKTIECSIMDLADDIAYSIYDLEDALQARFSEPLDLLSVDRETRKKIAQKVETGMKRVRQELTKLGFDDEYSKYDDQIDEGYDHQRINEILYKFFSDELTKRVEMGEREKEIHSYDDPEQALEEATSDKYKIASAVKVHNVSEKISSNTYERLKLTSNMMGFFIQETDILINYDNPPLSRVYMNPKSREIVEVLKHFNYESHVQSTRLQVVEFRGREIVKEILDGVKEGETTMLPDDYQILIDRAPARLKPRILCDFVAGMTDSYALDYYKRIKSADEKTIFRPY